MADKPKSSPDRDLTDTSLREERSKTDQAFAERQTAVQLDADRGTQRARDDADAMLTAARAEADRVLALATGGLPAASVVQGRVMEDDAIRDQRATADANLRHEREETARALARLLPLERERTDRYLLTERARADADIAHRDNFLAMVSHDLGNLLGGIVASAAALTEGASGSEDRAWVEQPASRIQRLAARMNRLIGDLVDVASIDAGMLTLTRAPEDGRRPVTDAVEIFRETAASKQINLVVEVPGDQLVAEFDHVRVLQVLVNLLSNAIKFTEPDGTITVRCRAEAGVLHFCVTDNGPGIPSEMLTLSFERFWQVQKHDRRGWAWGSTFRAASSRRTPAGSGRRARSAAGPPSTSPFP